MFTKLTLINKRQEQEELQKMNRMTKQEKNLNKMDLQAYKLNDYQLHSLVPGLQHSRYEFNGSPTMKKLAASTLVSPKASLLNDNPSNILHDFQNGLIIYYIKYFSWLPKN